MAELTIIPINQVGIDEQASLVAADVSLSDTVKASSGIKFTVDNADASTHTVTVTPPVSKASCSPYGTVAIEPIVHSILTNSQVSFTVPIGYSANGIITLEYDDVTSVKVGAFSVV